VSNISNYLEEALLNHVMRNVEYSRPTTVYCGLIDDSGTDAELEAGILDHEITNYDGDRKIVTFGAPSQVDGKATIKNLTVLEFQNMPAVKVKYAIICDAAIGGNILCWCPLTEEKTCQIYNTLKIPVGELVLDFD